MTTIELVPLGTLTVALGETVRMLGTPSGERVVVEFPAIEFVGDRIRAHRKGATAADWLVIAPDGTAQVDIRFTLETQDGALIYVQMNGRTDATKFASGGPLYMAPRFETGDPRYAWLNRIQAISKGAFADGKVTNHVFETR